MAVFAFFTIFGGSNFASAAGAASWLNVAAALGIVAIPIGLLMIAGELDISIGSLIPAGSMTVAVISGHFHAPILVGILVALALGALVGFINGVLVVRTAVRSFMCHAGHAVCGCRADARPFRHPHRHHERCLESWAGGKMAA